MNRKDLPAPNAKCEICDHEYYRCKKCIELRTRGIEAWRIHCDCYECYQVYILTNIMEPSQVTREQLENVKNIEMPEGKKINAEAQKKLDAIEKMIKERETATSRPIEEKKDERANNNQGKNYDKNEKNDKNDKNSDKKQYKDYGGFGWNKHNKDVK